VQRQQPASPVAKVLARIHLEQRNPERAVEVLGSYLRAVPGDLQAVALLAETHLAQGRHARAAQVAQDGLRQQDLPALRTLAGMGLLGVGRIPEAVAELEAALAADAQQLRAATALVAIYQQSGQFARAAQLAQRLAEQQPRNPGPSYMLGQARSAEGNAEAAQRAYEQALRIDPAFHAAQVGLARLEIGRGALDAASARLAGVLARETGQLEAMVEMARIQERRGDLAEARRWLERADDLAGPNNVQAGLALVEFHLLHGQAEAAREGLRRLNTKMPDALPVLLISARTFIAGGDTVAARASLTRASGIAGYEAPTLLQIARLQLEIGHLPGATQSLRKVLSQRPDDLQALTLMAELDLRQSEWARAEQTARQIVAQHPRAGIGHVLLGDIAQARGRAPCGAGKLPPRPSGRALAGHPGALVRGAGGKRRDGGQPAGRSMAEPAP
jgi:cellulose synthase operon protein C